MSEDPSIFTSDRREPNRAAWSGTDWEAGTVQNVEITEDGLTPNSQPQSSGVPSGGVYYDFETGTLPSAVRGEGSIVNSVATESLFGQYSWLSNGGGIDDMAYVEIDGNTHDKMYFEAWWKNPLDVRVDFFEAHSAQNTISYDFFNDGSSYYHYDGSRHFLFQIDPNSWYRSEVYFDRLSNFFELEIYDTENALVASRSDGSAVDPDSPRNPMYGPGSRNDGGRLFIDEVFVIPEDYRGNAPVVSVP